MKLKLGFPACLHATPGELLAVDMQGNVLVLNEIWQCTRFDEQYAGINVDADLAMGAGVGAGK